MKKIVNGKKNMCEIKEKIQQINKNSPKYSVKVACKLTEKKYGCIKYVFKI